VSDKMPKTLGQALDSYRPSKILSYDFWIGVLGAPGAVLLAVTSPLTLHRALPVAAGLVGVVIGAVVAGVAVIAAFMDQAFLRKVKRLGRQPIRYMRPFLFTATLGVVASLLLLVLIALPDSTPTWLTGIVAGLCGFAVVWTLASLIPALDMLVQFVGLRFIASDIPDDLPTDPSADAPADHGGPGPGDDPPPAGGDWTEHVEPPPLGARQVRGA